jgi:hypothetical protein
LKISALKFGRGWSVAAGLPALIALICTLAIQPRRTADTVDLNAAAERQPIELTEENEPRSLPTSIAADEMPGMTMGPGAVIGDDTLTEESVDERPAFEGSWARELRALKELAAKDSEAALERVSQMSVAEEREAALKEVCLQLAVSDPASAMNAAWQFQLGSLGGLAENAVLEELAGRWAATDLSAALAWLSQQPLDEAGQRDRVLKGIAFAWSKESPADAVRLVIEHMSPDYAQCDAAIKLAGRWAAVDFSTAAAWVDLFPEGSIQDRAREELSKVAPAQQQ